jgi:DNA polymerase alpha subunit B
MQEQLLKHAGLPAEVVALRTPVGVPSQDGVVCYGRVCCEAAEGKINKTSVLLEGGRMEGGQRVKLVLNEVAAYALFPGQFVVVEGINSSGGKMVVRNLCEGVPRPLPMSCPNELTKLQHGTGLNCQGGQPLRLMVGSGPFCCADNLDFEPLRDLLHQAAKLDPVEVLILTGPFLDAAHPQVASGMTQMTAEDGTLETIDLHTLFYYKVSGIIEAFFQENPELSLQIVLVPSLADAHHDHVYPQPPLGDRVAGGVDSPFFPGEKYFCLDIPKSKGGAAKRAVHCVGNPSMLKINEVVVGVTSTDVLMHLGKEEIAQRPVGSNRLERLVDHLVHQQSFYPLFPAPSGGGDACPLDMRFNDKWRMPVSPDVLLVPSRLATFARRLGNGTLAVNPGQLAKGASGGTYAKLTVHPMPAEQLKQATEGTAQPIRHQVAERTSLQIKRI